MKPVLILLALAVATWLAFGLVRNLGNHTAIFHDSPESLLAHPFIK